MNNGKLPQHPPTWRKPAGMLLIVGLIGLWAFVIASQSATINGWPVMIQAIVYLLAGTLWILPLRPLLLWMETGKWRE